MGQPSLPVQMLVSPSALIAAAAAASHYQALLRNLLQIAIHCFLDWLMPLLAMTRPLPLRLLLLQLLPPLPLWWLVVAAGAVTVRGCSHHTGQQGTLHVGCTGNVGSEKGRVQCCFCWRSFHTEGRCGSGKGVGRMEGGVRRCG